MDCNQTLIQTQGKNLGIQGLIQKRKPVIAQKAGELVREYLLNIDDLRKTVDKERVKKSIDRLVDKTLFLLPKVGKKILSKTLRELTYLYFFNKDGYIKEEILELALNDSDLESIIKEKILKYDISELEYIINKASGAEITFILISGGVLGFIVGIIEAFLPI